MIDASVTYRLAEALLHSLWIGAAIAVFAMLLCRIVVRRPEQRYALLVTTLVLTSLSLPAAFWLRPPSDRAVPSDRSAPVAATVDDQVIEVATAAQAASTIIPADTEFMLTTQPPATTSLVATIPDPPSQSDFGTRSSLWSQCLVAGWLVGMIIMLIRLVVALARGHRLIASSSEVADETMLAIYRRAAERIELSVAPKLFWCAEVTVPAVIGVARPVLLLPMAASTGLSPSQVESLLLHELAHVRRRDPWVNLFQLLCETIYFYHPAVWLVSNRLRQERELCCDDAVTGSGVDAIDYAAALVAVAQRACDDRRPRAVAIGADGRRSRLGQRIDRVLGRQQAEVSLIRGGSFALAMILLISLIGTLVVAAQPQDAGATEDAISQQASTAEADDSDTTTQQDNRQRWTRQLSSPDPVVRRMAIGWLAENPQPDDFDRTIRFLEDDDPNTRNNTIKLLGALKDTRAVDPLLARMKQSDSRNETHAVIRALVAIGDANAIGPLADFIRDNDQLDNYSIRCLTEFDDPRIREAMFSRFPSEGAVDFNLVYTLVGLNDRRIIPRMLELIDQPSKRRYSAIGVLGDLKANEAVEPILEILANPSDNERWRESDDEACADALGDIGDERAVAPLIALLDRTEEDDVQAASIRALAKLGDETAVAKIIPLMSNKSSRVREAARYAVGNLRLGARRSMRQSGLSAALPMAVAGLETGDGIVVVAAIEFLDEHAGSKTLRKIIPLIGDERPDVRIAAITTLIGHEPPILETEVLDAVATLDDRSKRYVAADLAAAGDPRALPILNQLVQDENPYVVRAAVEPLWQFGAAAMPILCEVLNNEERRARRAAITAIARITDDAAFDDAVVDSLIEYANSETDEGAISVLIGTLGRCHDPRSIKQLVTWLDDPKQRFTRRAAMALSRLGWQPDSPEQRIRFLVATGQSSNELVPRTVTEGNLVRGDFFLDLPIQTETRVGTGEFPDTVSIGSIVFHKTDGRLMATLKGGANSWPAMNVRAQLELLDGQGKVAATAVENQQWKGYLVSKMMRTSFEMEIACGEVDTDNLKRFQLTIENVPEVVAADVTITPPMETSFKADQPIPVALSAHRSGGVLMRATSVRFQTKESEDPSRPNFTTTVEINDPGTVDADWRVWAILLSKDGVVVTRSGYSGMQFSTQRVRDNDANEHETQIRQLELPFMTWYPKETIDRVRVGIELVAVHTGVDGKRVTEAVQHQVPASAQAIVADDGSAEGQRSLAASGHASKFDRPANVKFLEAVNIYASRYGTPKPPKADFYLYVLDGDQKVVAELKYPYSLIPRGELEWHTLRTPSVELPDSFHIALAFNPHRTKGIYLGYDDSPNQSNSSVGLPSDDFTAVKESRNWMIRPQVAAKASAELGTRLLKDRVRESSADPFAGTVEANAVEGKSAGRQSYGGAGPVVGINVDDLIPEDTPIDQVRLKGVRIYASRYGSGYEPSDPLDLLLVDGEAKSLWSHSFRFDALGYREKWVDLVLPEPVAIKPHLRNGKLQIAIDPHAHQRKGVYFHYLSAAEGEAESRGIVPGKRFFDAKDRTWMIRPFFTIDPN